MYSICKNIVLKFPQKNLKYAFSYGSSIFSQQGQPLDNSKLIDFVFICDDPVAWHKENMSIHKSHYTSCNLKLAKIIHQNDDRVYCNTICELDGRKFKYQVISSSALKLDLTTWNHIYIAGRLQKPVLWINPQQIDKNDELHSYLNTNWKNATALTMLLLNGRVFNEKDFYEKLASLSYHGDFRPEHANKIAMLVKGHEDEYRALYNPILKRLLNESGSCNELNRVKYLINILPDSIRMNNNKTISDDDIKSGTYRKILERNLEEIIKHNLRWQYYYNFRTAGFLKSVKYGYSKFDKWWRSRIYS